MPNRKWRCHIAQGECTLAISVIEPISLALERMRRMLFSPFDARKWFVLGFCAFLADLMEGGGGNGGGGNGGGGHGRGRGELPASFGGLVDAAWNWLCGNPLIALIIGLALILILAVIVVLTWLKSRGKFMFLDGVVHNRAAVVEPWRRFRQAGNSLFWFYLLFGFLGFVLVLSMVVGVLALVWPDIVNEEFGTGAVAAIVLGACLFVPIVVAMAVIGLFLDNIVVPTMYLRGLTVWPAWGVFGREVLAAQVGPVVLFCLMRILIRIAIGVLAVLACCFTCCVAILPYIGSVILLPLSVFDRCYSVYFLEQFGPSWRFFADEAPPAPTALLTPGGTT